MSRSSLRTSAALCTTIILAGLWVARAGTLTPPPGPVGPTLKTLVEVEPRTAVNATNTPGGADSVFTIAASGSYYLTGNVTGVSGKHGVKITAGDVTLDLNGFTLTGVAGSLSGVFVTDPGPPEPRHGVAVANGSVVGWGGSGVDLNFAATSHVERIRSRTCGAAGIVVSYDSGVSDCHSENNGGAGVIAGNLCSVRNCTTLFNHSWGITGGHQIALDHCTAETNEGGGFLLLNNCSVSNCVARNNYVTAGGGNGFQIGDDCVLTGCSAEINHGDGVAGTSGNAFINCTLTNNNGSGINAFDDITVSGTTASGNLFNGIWINGGAVTNCTANHNGGNGVSNFGNIALNVVHCDLSYNNGNGVFTDGTGRIEGCNVTHNNSDGIFVDSRVLILNNACDFNGNTGDSDGIHATGTDNRIDSNQVTNQAAGIQVIGAGNLVVRNSASGNIVNYEIAAGNRYGPVVDITAGGTLAVSGNTAASTVGSTDPWANFAY